jgi:hypothetical protein
LATPRFVPWDLPGRCSRCKSGTVEIDYVIQDQGVSIFSPRLKSGEKFIAFDKVAQFGDQAFMRIRARNKVLNIPFKRPEMMQVAREEIVNNYDHQYYNQIPLPPKPAQGQNRYFDLGDIPQ